MSPPNSGMRQPSPAWKCPLLTAAMWSFMRFRRGGWRIRRTSEVLLLRLIFRGGCWGGRSVEDIERDAVGGVRRIAVVDAVEDEVATKDEVRAQAGGEGAVGPALGVSSLARRKAGQALRGGMRQQCESGHDGQIFLAA